MVEEEHEPAARREHAGDLGDRRFVVGDVLEHQARDRGVEARVGERQALGGGAHVTRTAAALGRDAAAARASDRRRRPSAPSFDREPGDLALTGADVDHALRAGEALGREREDLLLVLGVDAVGEAVLPPAGVLLPEVRRRPSDRRSGTVQGNEGARSRPTSAEPTDDHAA